MAREIIKLEKCETKASCLGVVSAAMLIQVQVVRGLRLSGPKWFDRLFFHLQSSTHR